MKSGHNPKGHQNNTGKILAAGSYQSNFTYDDASADEWYNNIRHNLERIQQDVYRETFHLNYTSEADAAARVHQAVMNEFYQNIGDGDASKFVSHSTCFSCLRELPEHALPCGHVLCNPCTKAYGTQPEKTIVRLDSCPLHVSDTQFLAGFPWKIVTKPLYSGTRILSLDGYAPSYLLNKSP
jgi:hypothetical protein